MGELLADQDHAAPEGGIGMEFLLHQLGAKLCCIFASTIGGLTNVLTKRKFTFGAIKDVLVAALVGWIAAEFFLPMAMDELGIGDSTALALAFVVGYSGVRLLPVIEQKLFDKVQKL